LQHPGIEQVDAGEQGAESGVAGRQQPGLVAQRSRGGGIGKGLAQGVALRAVAGVEAQRLRQVVRPEQVGAAAAAGDAVRRACAGVAGRVVAGVVCRSPVSTAASRTGRVASSSSTFFRLLKRSDCVSSSPRVRRARRDTRSLSSIQLGSGVHKTTLSPSCSKGAATFSK